MAIDQDTAVVRYEGGIRRTLPAIAIYAEKGLNDLAQGARRWPLWTALAWQDIRKRYRGSVIGPLWITISMGLWVTTIGLLYSQLFKIPIETYLPFLTAGFLLWTLISQMITEAGTVYISAQGILKQMNLPLSLFAYQAVTRHVIVFLHNVIIYVVVAFLFPVAINLYWLLALPALVFYVINGIWISLLLGMVCARFRDVPPIVNSVLLVFFFLTPIFWTPETFAGRPVIYMANPFYHLIEIGRAPLLGNPPTLTSWGMVLAVTVGGWVLTFIVFSRFRKRVVFWL